MRSNNARVERYFGILKDDLQAECKLLCLLGEIKVGRYTKFQLKTVEAVLNEVDTKDQDATQELTGLDEVPLCQRSDEWSKKRRSRYTDFSRKCLEFVNERRDG